MYAIAGVTGHVGSVAAETLLSQGKPVRVIVRDAAKGTAWKAKGAEVAIADLSDEAGLARAFDGAAGAFVLLPPVTTSEQPIEDNARLTRTIAAAVKAAKLPHVVLLSSVGAQHPDGTGPIQTLHYAEAQLAATGAAVTAVRASYFQENWGAALGALAQGILPTFVAKDVRYPQVATKDIGRTIASALVEGGTRGVLTVIELAGPRDYTADDVAAALSTITGRSIPAVDAPLDAVVPTFTSFGLSKAVALLYREMYEGIASGRVASQAGNRTVRGSVEIGETLTALLAK
ncbi:MAG: NmrA family NAD(P)-binding protein [Kofleriaceae bacterium]